METNKEVIITTRVDKRIADQLKRKAKQKEMIFSKYVKRVLTNEVEKQKDEVKK